MPSRLTLDVSPENLSEARASLNRLVEELIDDRDAGNHVLLAIDEAIQNILRYGYRSEELPGKLEVTAWREGGDLIFELRDYAEPADLERIRPRAWDPARPGGLGLRLIHAAMDEVTYSHAPGGDGNILRLRKHLG